MTNEQAWDKLMHLAAQISGPLRRRFLGAIRDLQGTVPLAQLARWLEDGRVEKIIEAYTTGAQNATLFRIAAQEAAIASAVHVAANLPGKVLFTFNPHNPLAVQAVWDNGSKLIHQVTNDIREAVKLLVVDGIERGVGPRETARAIRDGIGLTKHQLRAVANFRKYLENGDSVVLQRMLRDRRFDSTIRSAIEGKKVLTKEQIDTQVAAYYRRYIDYRATTIARTESINALSLGQKMTWQQVFQTGKVDQNKVRRFWFTARGERTCELCAPIPGMNKDGVGFEESFQTPDGPRYGPTVHPDCRCVVFTRIP